MTMHSKSNAEKGKSGRALKYYLTNSFKQLVDENIIKKFDCEVSFQHVGFEYPKQYLINFLVETIDDKFILINSSTSFRNDRFKQQAYDISGVLNNSDISSDVIASIILYPDSEMDNSTFISFREKVKQGKSFSPTHNLLTLSEFYEFLENHKASVEAEMEEIKDIEDFAQIKDGSYYGKAGNALEKEVVNILNNKEYLEQYKHDKSEEVLFNCVLDILCSSGINKDEIEVIKSTNTVEKLAGGGNAKTDVIINIKTEQKTIIETLSIKNTSQKVVSCHDYKYEDFVRVLNVSGSKLEEYFKLFQETPSYSGFKDSLPKGYTVDEFEDMLKPHIQILTQWALTGEYDNQNLINRAKQISNYLLVVKGNKVYCNSFSSYIELLFKEATLKYGVPFGWTYPSKQRGKRIQLKMPILIE